MGRPWPRHHQLISSPKPSSDASSRPAQVEAIQGRITGVVGVENTAANTDLVIEAVFEDFDVKTAVFKTLDAACGPDTILASNTSSLSVNALG